MTKALGLYIHIPFCMQKCLYCDFCSFPAMGQDMRSLYVLRLADELHQKSLMAKDYVVNSVYFGGGTPTLLAPSDFSSLLSVVASDYHLSDNTEITTECNPKTVNKDALSSLRQLGINRISIGVQSQNDNELVALGRIHSAADAKQTVFDAYDAGFTDISADCMFGIPRQTNASWHRTLNELVSWPLSHISAYGLIVEEGTPFYEGRDTLPLPTEDEEWEMYRTACSFLPSNGFRQYEISNFAKPGMESKHNLKYWNADEYLGFGLSAHSYFGGKRFCHHRDLDAYLRKAPGEESIEDTAQNHTQKSLAEEYLMLRFRLRAGVDADVFEQRFGLSFAPYAERLRPYTEKGLIVNQGNNYRFSVSGFWLSNTVLSDILDFDEE